MTGDDLRDLERQRHKALVDFDAETASALHADDFQLINPAGVVVTKDEYLGGLASGFLNYLRFEPASDIAVYITPGAGIVRYRSNLEISIDGQPSEPSTYWHTDYYEERDGRWQVVWSQATRIEPPVHSGEPREGGQPTYTDMR